MRALTANFYLDSIKRLPQPRLRRRARGMCEEGLLTENGRRRSMLKEDLLKRFKLGSNSLELLERTRLLRSEPRHGSFYYEISHDRIAEAIHHKRQWRLPRKLQPVLITLLVFVGLLVLTLAIIAYYQADQARYQADQARLSYIRATTARQEADAAREKQKQLRTALEEVVNDLRRGGDASYNDFEFGEALASYQKALEFTNRKSDPELWAAVQVDVGRAHEALGTRVEEASEHLAAAVGAFRSALEVYTREQLPQDWALTQNYLGNALKEQALRTGGAQGTELLAQAVAAFQSALEVFSRERLPQQWALTQNNLGDTLKEQALRTGGIQGTERLAQAVIAFRSALEVYTREQLPQRWAIVQNNLGKALLEQGIRTGGTELLPLSAAPWKSEPATSCRKIGRRPRTTWVTRSKSKPSAPGAPKLPSCWSRRCPLSAAPWRFSPATSCRKIGR
jgi:tetratricopeptide (TPR) repeat protein